MGSDWAGFVLIYNTNGTFTVTEPGTIELLAVGGGGGGGGNNITSNNPNRGGGGGGGGGVYTNSSFGVSAGTYTVVIGAGGGAGQDGVARAPNGGNTTLSLGSGSALVTAYGGGGGGQSFGYSGSSGASGGGSSRSWVDTDYKNPGEAIYCDAPNYNLGHSGGQGRHPFGSGGGGGAGEAGSDGTDSPGKGGDGVEIPILASGMYYGGGGAGYRVGYTVAGGKGGGGTVGQPGENGKGGGGSGGQRGGSGTLVLAFTPSATVDSGFFEGEGGNEVIEIRDDSVRDEVRVFRQSGTLTLTGRGTVEVLAVGGGGGGGTLSEGGAGGGGAGGFVHYTDMAVSSGTYEIEIGAGGAVGSNGGVTRGLGVVAYGGGAGGKAGGQVGQDGASGGGASHSFSDINTTTNIGGRATKSAYANSGHDGYLSVHPWIPGGGGGAGGDAKAPQALNAEHAPTSGGGDGLPCSITGTEVYYAGGGAGYRTGAAIATPGGQGGGGSLGNNSTTNPGEDGKGGGGCGGSKGGSGIFIVRYHLKPLATVMYMR